MPTLRAATINNSQGRGYASTYRNDRGGKQARGEIYLEQSGVGEVQKEAVGAAKFTFTGTVYDEGNEYQLSFPIVIRSLNHIADGAHAVFEAAIFPQNPPIPEND